MSAWDEYRAARAAVDYVEVMASASPRWRGGRGAATLMSCSGSAPGRGAPGEEERLAQDWRSSPWLARASASQPARALAAGRGVRPPPELRGDGPRRARA